MTSAEIFHTCTQNAIKAMSWLPDMAKGKIFTVLGATGLIGRMLVQVLSNAGAAVVYRGVNHHPGPQDGLTFDINHASDMRTPLQWACSQSDYIIHAAGSAEPQKFTKSPLSCIEINTSRLMDVFEHSHEKKAKVLYLSSTEVYTGLNHVGSILHATEPMFGFTTATHPRAAYIDAKRCGEAICHAAAKQEGRKVKIARVNSVYGPGARLGDTRVLNQFVQSLLTHAEIHIRDDGMARRSFLYIEDCVVMLLNILFRGEDFTYNVVGGNPVTIKRLAELIAVTSGTPNQITRMPEARSENDNISLSSERYRREFGYIPCLTPLHVGLKPTIEWYAALFQEFAVTAAPPNLPNVSAT